MSNDSDTMLQVLRMLEKRKEEKMIELDGSQIPPAQSPPVMLALDNLNKELDILQNSVAELAEQLRPVCKPEMEPSPPPEQAKSHCDLEDRIRRHAVTVDNLNQYITVLRARLCI